MSERLRIAFWRLLAWLRLSSWWVEEDWGGTWRARREPGNPRVVERVRIGDGPGAIVTRPVHSMFLSEPVDERKLQAWLEEDE